MLGYHFLVIDMFERLAFSPPREKRSRQSELPSEMTTEERIKSSPPTEHVKFLSPIERLKPPPPIEERIKPSSLQ